VAAAPPTVTEAPSRFVPEITTVVPPVVGPEDGVTVPIVGLATYVKAPALVPVPPTVVTDTDFAPAVPAGVRAVRLRPSPATTTFVATAVPTFTVAPERFVPVIVMLVPAASGPEEGVTPAIVGAATYVKPPDCVTDPPAVVTTTSCAPAMPAGVFAVMPVADATTLVAATPPTVTVAPERFVPVSRMLVPPVAGPLDGVNPVTVGAATYVKPFARVAVPPAVVTTTLLGPAVPTGDTAVICVGLTTVTELAGAPPIATDGTPPIAVKFVPVIEIDVPAPNGPDDGVTEPIVGTATYVNAPPRLVEPPAVVTNTSFDPAVPAGVLAVRLKPSPATTTFVAAAVPTFTVAPTRFDPVNVIVEPPDSGPDTGDTSAIVGGAMYMNA
jgi:hypothetical protein